jgi:hypothetical protein
MKNDLSIKIQILKDEGKSQNEILYFLFSKKISITEAIVFVRKLYGIKLEEAKKLVAASQYWENMHTSNQNLHDALEEISKTSEDSKEFYSGNSINLIAPYKYLDMWVFDDPSKGLIKEPFVGGADTIIDSAVKDIKNAEQGFVMIFSEISFPGCSIKLEWQRSDGSGNWYYSRQFNMEGWLCPALLRYFSKAPKEIFIQIKPGRLG